MAVYNNARGNEVFRGINGEYNQVDYTGSLSDYTFVRNDNGSVTVTHPTLGRDTLIGIDGIWSSGDARWYSIDDAIAATAPSDGSFIDANGIITGGTGNNRLQGTNGQDIFYGDRGNDRIIGVGDEYDQVEYDGALLEYTFTVLDNGNLQVAHPTWGTDTLSDIDGFWFIREAAWYSVEDAINLTADLPRFRLDADDVVNGTPGNDLMRADADGWNFYGGTGNDRFFGARDSYDQVNYDGSALDYDFSVANNGDIIARSDIWGVDRLRDIDGIYFNGSNEWISTDDLFAG